MCNIYYTVISVLRYEFCEEPSSSLEITKMKMLRCLHVVSVKKEDILNGPLWPTRYATLCAI